MICRPYTSTWQQVAGKRKRQLKVGIIIIIISSSSSSSSSSIVIILH